MVIHPFRNYGTGVQLPNQINHVVFNMEEKKDEMSHSIQLNVSLSRVGREEGGGGGGGKLDAPRRRHKWFVTWFAVKNNLAGRMPSCV